MKTLLSWLSSRFRSYETFKYITSHDGADYYQSDYLFEVDKIWKFDGSTFRLQYEAGRYMIDDPIRYDYPKRYRCIGVPPGHPYPVFENVPKRAQTRCYAQDPVDMCPEPVDGYARQSLNWV